ncbi:phytanoyl-CoA dioxygenase domain-containing protein 1 homolog [Paramacrobiotus metropolitanus]|uniref:phytanoyl-CoA dioxygenase domain-containing protein 1 homolog n=1 Tax=Paramacrobiotus metropolitanus TaxID=2943436 RepID=UPI0024460592|nr:phytanoyl-CoA dioxygenase domain-containing protein 1 homolog [Paramacrobiotus metropolitanus]
MLTVITRRCGTITGYITAIWGAGKLVASQLVVRRTLIVAKMSQPDYVQEFNKNGYAVIPNFLSPQEVVALKSAMARIIDEMDPKDHSRHIFHHPDQESTHSQTKSDSFDDYFLNSGDKVRFYFEPKAVREDGSLTVPKDRAISRAGYAIGWLEPAFKKVTFSEKIKDICRMMGLVDPRLVQSVYLFKNPLLGQKVTTHQDSTFQNVDPPEKLLGFWIALDDAAVENGCLHFMPGTQHVPPTCHFIRNPNPTPGKLTMMRGAEPDEKEFPLERFKPAPVSKGSLVLIHGNVIHKSEDNTSDKPRNAYTFHVVDFNNARYSPENWLQPTEAMPFPKLYEVQV